MDVNKTKLWKVLHLLADLCSIFFSPLCRCTAVLHTSEEKVIEILVTNKEKDSGVNDANEKGDVGIFTASEKKGAENIGYLK